MVEFLAESGLVSSCLVQSLDFDVDFTNHYYYSVRSHTTTDLQLVT